MDSTPQDTTHDLLLAVAGRIDDDLLAWTRELVAVGDDGHALEMLTASLVADRVALPSPVRRRLVQLAGAARIELDADAELAPANPDDRTAHRFAAEESLAGPVATALVALPPRQLQDCRVLLTHRRTAAGAAPGPLPHPVLIVEVEPGTRRPDMLSYQLSVALERSGVPASVEVLTVGAAVPAYHAEALRSARQLRLERAAAPATDNRAETTVAVPALPTRRRSDAAAAQPDRSSPSRQAGATQPIAAAPPFGTSNSDTPLFDSPTPTPAAPDDADRPAEPAEPAAGRLTAVPSMFDESFPDGDEPADERSAEFHPDEFGRERRTTTPRPPEDDRPESRPTPHPKPRPTPVTPITRSPGTGPTAIPLLRRNGRRPLAPVGSDDAFGSEDVFREAGHEPDPGYDPLNDPLSRPLMAPVLDPTPPLTGPIGLVGGPPGRGDAAGDETWSGDWLSGAWAVPRDGEEQQPVEPEPVEPAPRPVRRAPRHRYLRASDPIEDDAATGRTDARPPTGAIPLPPAGDPAPASGAIPLPPARGAIPLPPASGAIPLPPAGRAPDATGSGAIPLPPATTGGVPQTPTRPAIPMPGGDSRDPAGPPQLRDLDPALGLRPESLARLGEADLDLLAKLQAELRAERRPHTDFAGSGTPAEGLPVGSGTNGSYAGAANGHGYYGGSSNGHETNGSRNGGGRDDPDRNGSSRHGTGQRRGPFGRRRAERADPDGDGNPPDIAG